MRKPNFLNWNIISLCYFLLNTFIKEFIMKIFKNYYLGFHYANMNQFLIARSDTGKCIQKSLHFFLLLIFKNQWFYCKLYFPVLKQADYQTEGGPLQMERDYNFNFVLWQGKKLESELHSLNRGSLETSVSSIWAIHSKIFNEPVNKRNLII